jgi:hypothetical protein
VVITRQVWWQLAIESSGRCGFGEGGEGDLGCKLLITVTFSEHSNQEHDSVPTVITDCYDSNRVSHLHVTVMTPTQIRHSNFSYDYVPVTLRFFDYGPPEHEIESN